MGLRRALGASDSQVVAEVVRSGMRDAALVTWLPAWRALLVDPAATLREE